VAAPAEAFSWTALWTAFGTLGAVIFYGRFWVQWIVSERRRQSVVPIAFWYMSAVGSVMVFTYAVHLRNPGMAFGQCFNIVVYSRNLTHIWRERGQLTRRLYVAVHGGAGVVVAVAMGFMIMTWYREFNRGLASEEAVRNWFWLGVWGVGQVLFFLRFFVQWLTTEIKRKSVVPPVFWYLSLAAAVLHAAFYVQRGHWIFTAGMVATILIYARNIWFIRNTENDS